MSFQMFLILLSGTPVCKMRNFEKKCRNFVSEAFLIVFSCWYFCAKNYPKLFSIFSHFAHWGATPHNDHTLTHFKFSDIADWNPNLQNETNSRRGSGTLFQNRFSLCLPIVISVCENIQRNSRIVLISFCKLGNH